MNPQAARAQHRHAVDYGVSVVPFAGERESGDHYLVQPVWRGTLIAVADGIGHGAGAARAARLAIATLRDYPGLDLAGPDLAAMMRRCDKSVRTTRGVVMCVAQIDGEAGTLRWVGAGNITAALVRGGLPRRVESLLVRAGVIGYRLPALQPSVAKIERGDLLVIATDGIGSGFTEELSADFIGAARPERIATWISARHGKTSDDGLVLVARYTGA